MGKLSKIVQSHLSVGYLSYVLGVFLALKTWDFVAEESMTVGVLVYEYMMVLFFGLLFYFFTPSGILKKALSKVEKRIGVSLLYFGVGYTFSLGAGYVVGSAESVLGIYSFVVLAVFEVLGFVAVLMLFNRGSE